MTPATPEPAMTQSGFGLHFLRTKIAITKHVTYIYYLHGESIIFNRNKVNFENYMTILGHFSKEFERTTDRDLRILIKEKIIKFKEMILIIQWKTIKEKD